MDLNGLKRTFTRKGVFGVTFSELVQTLYPYCGRGQTRSDFVLTLIKNTIEGDDDRIVPTLDDMSADYLVRLFGGTKDFPQKTAVFVLGHLDKRNFVDFIANLTDDTLEGLRAALIDRGLDVTDKYGVPAKCADVLAEIMTDSARKPRRQIQRSVINRISDKPSFGGGDVPNIESVSTEENNQNTDTADERSSRTESTPTVISRDVISSAPKQTIERDYYNLVVTTDEINHGKTTILRTRSLKADTEIVKQLSDFSAASRARLMTFPSLIMNENTEYAGRTDSEQQAYFGFIADIKVHENGKVRIKFHCEATIPQQAINKIIDRLDIHGGMAIMELNHTHWTVKNVDLIEELTESGLLPVKEAQ